MSELLRKHCCPAPIFLREPDDWPRATYLRPGTTDQRQTTKLVELRKGPAKMRVRAARAGIEAARIMPAHLGGHFKAAIDATVYVGRRNNEAHLRLQDKTADNRNGDQRQDLAPGDRRSRIELCLMRQDLETIGGPDAVGLNCLDDLFGFEFHRLRKAFDFRLPTVTPNPSSGLLECPNPEELEVFGRTGAFGLDLYQRAQDALNRAEGTRLGTTPPLESRKKGHALAYDRLNKKVDRALRKLSRNWSAQKSGAAWTECAC